MFGGETRILSTTDRGNTGVRGLTDPAFSSGGHGMSFTPFYRAPSSVSIDRFMLRQSLFFYLFVFACDISKTAQPCPSSPNLPDGKWAAIDQLSFGFLVSELFRQWKEGSKSVTFAPYSELRNATWRQNGFTYRKKNAV